MAPPPPQTQGAPEGPAAGPAAGPARALRTPALLAWLRLLRVWHKVTRVAAEDLRAAGLTTGQFAVLVHVGAAEGLAQQQLAARLAVTQGNVCQLLDKLERAGLLERRQEGRTNRLFLTPAGRARHRRVVPAHEALVAAQFAGLPTAQQAQLHRLLRDLDRSIGTSGGPERDGAMRAPERAHQRR
jgi:DNA-binding MarR family transcriptional regulator